MNYDKEMKYPTSIQELIDDFTTLPGVGKRTARRFVFHLLQQSDTFIDSFSKHLTQLKRHIKICSICSNISTQDPCPICANIKRDKETICVVSHVQNLQAIEQTHEYKGVYQVLGGTLNAIEGITPDKLHVKQLLNRVKKGPIKEIILALNPDLQGESTSLYLIRVISSMNPDVKITRLARGLPMGADVEYADSVTLSNALSSRQNVQK